MIGKGVLGECFQPRTCSGNGAPKTGQAKDYSENVVIDIDGDQVDEVVIIDFPDYAQQKSHGSSVQSRDKKYPFQSVISIDDDDDESDEAGHTEIIAEGGGELDSDASSSKRFSSGPGFMGNSVHLDNDDSPVIFEKGCPSKLPQSRKPSSAQAADRNRYGLDSSESESSESDCSDCELMEVCEQWEKASKRRRNIFNDRARFDEQASSSGLNSSYNVNIEVENRTEQNAGTSLYSGPSNGKCAMNPAHTGDNKIDDADPNMGKEYPCKNFGQKNDQESYNYFSFGSTEKVQSLYQSSDSLREEMKRSEECRPCPKDKSYNVASEFNKEADDRDFKFMSSTQEESKRQIESDGSGFRNRDSNFPDTHSSGASFDEIQLHQDESVSQERSVMDIINEREKLKETDEYKQAIEEEWASRKRQLQIQAEEAQRLRKRKKAESKRLLDMQRRQKERIEEVRETQKKDEENMNIKEQLRIEIRKQLNKLEITCVDMASLLRGLGIQVGGGFSPLPQEVHTAYKRALLRFHPDRASKTDIREQVEAEEKFKLISRMKEKFLTTCF